MFSPDIPVFFWIHVSFCSEMANSRKRVRLSLVIDFDSLEGKNVFKRRLDYVRKVLTPTGRSDLDTIVLCQPSLILLCIIQYSNKSCYLLLSTV